MESYRSTLTTTVLLCVGAVVAYAQSLRFEHISLQRGLSQSSAYSITQDKEGFLWFGTEDWLGRYDSYSFKVLKNGLSDFTSSSGNYVIRLIVDREGMLCV
ncbi:MAG TPA: two-component regulator propeller domain-containing protein [Candidatus Kryptonia bacterium]